MAEENCDTTTLRILKLSIIDCLNCQHDELSFAPQSNVHLLLYNLEQQSKQALPRTPVAQALQLLCTLDYVDAQSLERMPQLQLGKGELRLTMKLESKQQQREADYDSELELDMEPSTSAQAREREEQRRARKRRRAVINCEVRVVRRFDNELELHRMMYQIDEQPWQTVTVLEFHSLFFVQPAHGSEQLGGDAEQSYARDWLRVIQAQELSYNASRDGNPFDIFVKLFNSQQAVPKQLLCKLTSACVECTEQLRLAERRFVLQVFRHVRQMFEYITDNDYSVWFFVPSLNRYEELDRVHVDDFDLRNVRTSIKLTRDGSEFFWHHAEHNIKDILHVAFQLVLAKLSRQSLLFIGSLEQLNDFICLQYIKAAFMNSVYAKDHWYCARYLHRMLELAESMELLVIIEYPSGLTLLPEHRAVIKCIQQLDALTGDVKWNLFEDITLKSNAALAQLQQAINLN
ncbi:ord [Drosophila busckii]|uniref:Ord n=1 Tax=Drosophila busckii TaxID=30019 RepID=A0A0M4E925_DROBS|nr:protein ORD [Drosophila busckii]ALC41334.1 ord [Drosophila busckii]